VEMSSIYIEVPVTDRVKLKPHQLCQNIKPLLVDLLKSKFEGKCAYHGYIEKGSITEDSIVNYSSGKVRDVLLNGDVEYVVTYNAKICNPAKGSIVKAKVVNQNMYGILADAQKVLEIIIPKKDSDVDVDLNLIKTGDEIHVEIIGKKFELGDTKMTIVGKIGRDKNKKLLDAAQLVLDKIAADGIIQDLDPDEDEDEDDEENEDEEEEDEEEEGDEEVSKSKAISDDEDDEDEDEEEEDDEVEDDEEEEDDDDAASV